MVPLVKQCLGLHQLDILDCILLQMQERLSKASRLQEHRRHHHQKQDLDIRRKVAWLCIRM
jgi:hypothetical protein